MRRALFVFAKLNPGLRYVQVGCDSCGVYVRAMSCCWAQLALARAQQLPVDCLLSNAMHDKSLLQRLIPCCCPYLWPAGHERAVCAAVLPVPHRCGQTKQDARQTMHDAWQPAGWACRDLRAHVLKAVFCSCGSKRPSQLQAQLSLLTAHMTLHHASRQIRSPRRRRQQRQTPFGASAT